jgi:hypothetical protein
MLPLRSHSHVMLWDYVKGNLNLKQQVQRPAAGGVCESDELEKLHASAVGGACESDGLEKLHRHCSIAARRSKLTAPLVYS